MKKARKIAAFLIAAAMSLCVLPSSAIAEEAGSGTVTEISDGTNDGTGDGTSEVGDGESEEGSEDYGIAPMSLLPIKEVIDKEVTIDRIKSGIDGYSEYAYYVKEALGQILFEDEIITDLDSCNKVIMYSDFEDSDKYRKVEWDDIIEPSTVYLSGNTYSTYANFIVGDGDQLSIDNIKYRNVHITFSSFGQQFVDDLKFNLYDESGKRISPINSQEFMTNDDGDHYYYVSKDLSVIQIGKGKLPGLNITLPKEYTTEDVKIYDGLIYDKKALASAKDITKELTDDSKPYQMTSSYSGAMWCSKDMTFSVTTSSGYECLIPVRFYVGINSNYITLNSGSGRNGYINDSLNNIYISDLYVFYGKNNFDGIDAYVTAKYCDYTNNNGNNNPEAVDFACFGDYSSPKAAESAGEKNIKDDLFVNGVKVDFTRFKDETKNTLDDGTKVTLREVKFTIFDTYGAVMHRSFYFAITPDKNSASSHLSEDTYFNVSGAGGGSEPVSSYPMPSGDDSYFMNGYQTIFMLNENGGPVKSGEIKPIFTPSGGAKITREDDNEEQVSGVSTVEFNAPETVVKYYAVSENNERLKNYWVTFITQQSGAHLFVNGINSAEKDQTPKREVFLDSAHNYVHDIFIANTGSEKLTDITAVLSEDTKGVKLDPYWQVIDGSTRSLNPFKKLGYNEFDSIAKIRLIPEKEGKFGAISGKLTISSNGGECTIELSGLAGVPKITTTQNQIFDGVKYVPYSCIIGTNNMYETNGMSFKLVRGNLPEGLTLNENTGEIYGVPKEAGSFPITVQATYTGNVPTDSSDYTSTASYVLLIKDNTDDNVDAVNSDDQGEKLTKSIDKYLTVYYNGRNGNYPISIDRVETSTGGLLRNEFFDSEGKYASDFMAFYLDGEKLTEGQDYTAVEGSTVITVIEQTLKNLAIEENSTHTLAAEFRAEKKPDGEFSRSAQNIHLKYVNLHPKNDISGGSGNTGNPGSVSGSHQAVGMPAATLAKSKPASVSSRSVNAVMSFVDGNGKPLSGVALELHSDPMTALTDASGAAAFDNIEFGKHTLYIKDSSGKALAEKKFSIASGKSVKIKNDVITAVAGEPLYLSVQFDGSEITFLTAGGEDVSVAAGIDADGEIIEVNFNNNRYFAFIIIPIIAVSAALILFAKKRNN